MLSAGALRGGATLSGNRQNNWPVVRLTIHKVAGVRWVRTHLTEEEANATGIPLPPWALHRRADEQAAHGVRGETLTDVPECRRSDAATH